MLCFYAFLVFFVYFSCVFCILCVCLYISHVCFVSCVFVCIFLMCALYPVCLFVYFSCVFCILCVCLYISHVCFVFCVFFRIFLMCALYPVRLFVCLYVYVDCTLWEINYIILLQLLIRKWNNEGRELWCIIVFPNRLRNLTGKRIAGKCELTVGLHGPTCNW